jgi:hypothetical protein
MSAAASSLGRGLGVMITRAPVPLFGSVGVAAQWSKQFAKELPRYAPWLGPFAVGGFWFIWPAVGDESKISWGIMKDPNPEPPVDA